MAPAPTWPGGTRSGLLNLRCVRVTVTEPAGARESTESVLGPHQLKSLQSVSCHGGRQSENAETALGWVLPAEFLIVISSQTSRATHNTPYWYIEHITIISTIPLALIGFGFTLWQVRKTRTAAEAARDAAKNAQRGIGRGSLLVLIPQLQRTEEELERAVRSGYSDIAMSWLGTWRWQAGQLRGLINVASTDRAVLRAIQASVVAAAEAKTELVGSIGVDLVIATKDVRTAIAAVTNQLGELAVVQGMQMGQDSND